MGSKDKFWCQLPDEQGGGRWLFKQPRQQTDNTEHLSEKIAQEVADLIKVPCARIQLAEFRTIRGTISRDIQLPGEVLVHGNEVIAGRVMGYDRSKKRHTSDHTFENIRKAILGVCKGRCEEDLNQFAGFLVLDALVGNTDRHHENWALLRRESLQGVDYRLAPSFDHASSLGRELKDERRLLLLQRNRLDEYIHRGPGAVYLAVLGEKAISPVELVQRLVVSFPDCFRPWLRSLEGVTTEAVEAILSRVPVGWMSDQQRQFAASLMKRARELMAGFIA